MLPASFTLDGKSFNPYGSVRVPERVKRFLDKTKFGTLYSSVEVGKQVGATAESVVARQSVLKGYFLSSGHKMIWGSKQSIAALEKSLADND